MHVYIVTFSLGNQGVQKQEMNHEFFMVLWLGAEVHFMENVFGDFEFPNFDEAWSSQWTEASELESHGHGQFLDLPSYKMGGFSAMWNHQRIILCWHHPFSAYFLYFCTL